MIPTDSGFQVVSESRVLRKRYAVSFREGASTAGSIAQWIGKVPACLKLESIDGPDSLGLCTLYFVQELEEGGVP